MKLQLHLAVRRSCLCAGLVFALIATPVLHAQVAGSLDPAFNPDVTGSYILATAVQPDGKIVIAGNFTSVNGQPRNGIARLHPDGGVESTNTFNTGSGVGGDVSCVVVQADGKILIGGSFGNVDGQPRGNIARLHADGSVESTDTFNPGVGVGGRVLSMAAQADGKILLAGFFNSVDGQPCGYIARLNSDGTVESTATFNPGTGANFGIQCVAVQADGKIVIGGDFTSVDGQSRNGIARLNSDGTVESTATFDPGIGMGGDNPAVVSVAVQADGKILFGGYFSSVNGEPRNRIVRLHANGTLESTNTFNPGTGADDTVNSVALQADGRIVLGGYFSTVNDQPRKKIARLHPDGTVESTATFNSGTGVEYNLGGVMLQDDGKILVEGNIISVNGQPRTHIARLANDVATSGLTISNRTRIDWFRGGAAPEVEQVTFEISTNGGAIWNLAGTGTRIARGWECTGLSLPISGFIRARGRTVGATFSGSSGLVEQIAAFSFVARGIIENVLTEMIALRATVTNRVDGGQLDVAIKHLTRSLATNLWVDEIHLERERGSRVFHESTLTVWTLCHAIKSRTNQLPDAVLQGFIERIVQADRLLATVAIDDAISAGASSNRIEQAQNYLARGDAKRADDNCRDGIVDYSLAWQRATQAKVSASTH